MNQHYVPRVYLKNFAIEKGNSKYVDVYDNGSRRYFNVNIEKICAEKHLYTLEYPLAQSNDKYIIEKLYSDFIEPFYIKAYTILNNPNVIDISAKQHADIIKNVSLLNNISICWM